MAIPQNQYYSYNLGELPKGCQYCVRGEKLVLFITGICPRKCYFCPVSDDKFGKDVCFANERKITEENGGMSEEGNREGNKRRKGERNEKTNKINPEELVKEAELMDAKGAGITGGDPLSRLERTVECIKLLKERFGREFHIHLYTSLNLAEENKLKELSEAGLDEIRFHLDLGDDKLWAKIRLAGKFAWDIGVEIPLIPGKEKEIRKIIDFITGKDKKVKFLNLNELERADNELSKLGELGFEVKEKYSYAIKDSLELGLKLLEYVKLKNSSELKNHPLSVHLCTAELKDKIQLSRRIKREGAHNHKSFDIVDEEGLLTRGALYLEELAPGFGYREKLKGINKEEFVKRLVPTFQKIKEKFHLNEEEIFLDEEKPRILLSAKRIEKKKDYFKKLGLLPAVVKEYPTADQLEVEVEFLK